LRSRMRPGCGRRIKLIAFSGEAGTGPRKENV
jgi:hypothetical protein